MKKTTFKFKETMISNGEYLSDGHFLAKIDLPEVIWKAPNDKATAKLINKEPFRFQNKTFDNWIPEIDQILSQEKDACHSLVDTKIVLKHESFDVRLFHNLEIGYVGIDDRYTFILENNNMRTKDTSNPIFCDIGCVMPIANPLAGFTDWIK